MFLFNLSFSKTAVIGRNQLEQLSQLSEVKPRDHNGWRGGIIQGKKGKNGNEIPVNSVWVVRDLKWLTIGPSDEIFLPSSLVIFYDILTII